MMQIALFLPAGFGWR